MNKASGLKLFTLVMLITGSIDSIRNLPAASLFGTNMIFFFILAAIVFLMPAALVSAELSSTWTKQGGIYHWVKLAFGEKLAFMAIWLQWINTMVWYPTILSFIAGTAAYLINPALAQDKAYLVAVILIVFWFLTWLNLKGVQVSAKFASRCAVIGMIIPMVLVIVLAFIWVMMGKPVQIHFHLNNMMPHISHTGNWISLTAIMTAFLGLELATVHVRDVHQPQKTFPKAMLISTIIILSTMILGAMAIALLLPKNNIHLVDGVMQVFANLFTAYHLSWLIPVIALMLVIGSIGSMINWVISPAKGLLQAAEQGYLPAFFTRKNKNGVASRILIMQAVLVSFICLAFLLMPSVNGSYWLLTDLSTQLYILMYVLMFLSCVKLKLKFPDRERPFAMPGGKLGAFAICTLGLIGCTITLIVGFFPPESINVGGVLHYEEMFSGGILMMLLPVVLFYYHKQQNQYVRL